MICNRKAAREAEYVVRKSNVTIAHRGRRVIIIADTKAEAGAFYDAIVRFRKDGE